VKERKGKRNKVELINILIGKVACVILEKSSSPFFLPPSLPPSLLAYLGFSRVKAPNTLHSVNGGSE
jgi:hypothetical protein